MPEAAPEVPGSDGVGAQARAYRPIATDGVEVPSPGARKLTPPESDNVRRVGDHLLATNPDWVTLIALVAWAGRRRGEVCDLRWDGFDLKGKSILIHNSVVAVLEWVAERASQTGEQRRIAIGPKTAALLRKHQARCQHQAKKCQAGIEPGTYVFPHDAAGGSRTRPHRHPHVHCSVRGSGVVGMSLHDLRHHSAATLLKNGAASGEAMDSHG